MLTSVSTGRETILGRPIVALRNRRQLKQQVKKGETGGRGKGNAKM